MGAHERRLASTGGSEERIDPIRSRNVYCALRTVISPSSDWFSEPASVVIHTSR